MMDKIQTRGNCQCCGLQHAVKKGLIAKHGYKVLERGNEGWFEGTCDGHSHAPMQIDRSVTDLVVANIRNEVLGMRERAEHLHTGALTPETVQTSDYDWDAKCYKRILWAEASDYQRKFEIRDQVCYLLNRALQGERTANKLETLANKVHGMELEVVKKPEAPAPVMVGDKRKLPRDTVTATYVQAGKVFWVDSRGFKGASSTRAWRLCPEA